MPIYDYKCLECGEVGEFLVPSTADGGTLACPSCGSQNLERLISAPSLLIDNRVNAPGTTCCGREERCEVPPCSSGERCWRQ